MTEPTAPESADQAGQGSPAGPVPTNSAGDNAQVGAQIGFVAGNVNFYRVPAERGAKYKVAINFLRGSSGTRAATLIREAVKAGLGTDGLTPVNDIAYHWVLAVLSGRSFEQLGPDDFEAIEHARGIADRQDPGDHLLVAHDFMCRLVESRKRQAESAGLDPGFGQLLADYLAITSNPPKSGKVSFAEDFDRHLELMLAGGIEDQIAADMADRAKIGRMSNERTGRAWKYFEPVPERPRLLTMTEPVFPMGSTVLAVAAATLCVAGVVLALAVLQERGALQALLLTVVIAIAGVTATRSRVSFLAAMERVADRDSDFGHRHLGRYASPVPPAAESGQFGLPDEPDEEDEADKARQDRARRVKFVRMLSIHLNDQFAKRAPRGVAARRKWDADTAGLKESAKRQLLTQYSEPELAPGAVNWLVTLRVQEIAQKQRDGTLRKYQQELAPRPRVVIGFALGVVVSAVAWGYALFLALTKNPVLAGVAIAALGVAVLLIVQSRLDVYLVVRHRLVADKQDALARLKADESEYERWVRKLQGLADDLIARWLDYDKIHLRQLAMTQLDLASRDVLMHATVTEPAPRCILVRTPFGPPRYSVYRVTVFLLTKAGVRLVRMTLDFRTGEVYNQVRRSFRYDVITSASATETGVRYDSGRREVMPTPENPWSLGQDGSLTTARHQELRRSIIDGSAILSQDFQLSLRNGERVTFLVENITAAFSDRSDEDPISLLDLALDNSGLSVALEMLENISGHGSQWVEDRLTRRRRTRRGLHVADAPAADDEPGREDEDHRGDVA